MGQRAATWRRNPVPGFSACLGCKVLAACQFRADRFMNGWLTVNVPVVSRQGLGTSAAMSPWNERPQANGVSIHSGIFAR
jgi:hypothetical protein